MKFLRRHKAVVVNKAPIVVEPAVLVEMIERVLREDYSPSIQKMIADRAVEKAEYRIVASFDRRVAEEVARQLAIAGRP